MCAGTCIYFLVSRVTLRCSSVNKCPCLTTKVYSDFQHCLFGLWSVVTSFCFQILHFIWWSFYLFVEVSVFRPKIVAIGYHWFEKYLSHHFICGKISMILRWRNIMDMWQLNSWQRCVMTVYYVDICIFTIWDVTFVFNF